MMAEEKDRSDEEILATAEKNFIGVLQRTTGALNLQAVALAGCAEKFANGSPEDVQALCLLVQMSNAERAITELLAQAKAQKGGGS